MILSLGFNLRGVPGEMALPYEAWIVGQITKEDIKLTSRHFPVIVLPLRSETSRDFHLSQSYYEFTERTENITPDKI